MQNFPQMYLSRIVVSKIFLILYYIVTNQSNVSIYLEAENKGVSIKGGAS